MKADSFFSNALLSQQQLFELGHCGTAFKELIFVHELCRAKCGKEQVLGQDCRCQTQAKML